MRSLQLVTIAAAANCAVLPLQHGNDDDGRSPLPLIIWHGLGDQYNSPGMKEVGEIAEEVNPGTFVHAIRLSDDGGADQRATFLGNLNNQVDQVCNDLAKHPILKTAPAVNALGFSQGGQFLRAYVERCNNPPVATLVTFGSQHNGIAEFQHCQTGSLICNGWQAIVKRQTWAGYIQHNFVPAQYYRNPDDLTNYIEHSNFLADINNEKPLKNLTYIENMKKLEKFVMYIFKDDTTVIPKWSGWFEEFNATTEERTKLQDRPLYKRDYLGLKWLDERGRLEFKETEGAHMTLSVELLQKVFKKYFSKRVDVPDDEESLDL